MAFLFYLSSIFMKAPFFYLLMVILMGYLFCLYTFVNKRINLYSLLILLYLGFLLVHMIFVSNISVTDILNVKYFRTEGRIFFAFIPFLYFSTFGISKIHFNYLLKSFYFTFAAYTFLILIHTLEIYKIDSLFYGPYDLFSGFFSTKNAAGNFIGFFLITFFLSYKSISYKNIILFVLILVPFVLASSRQAYVSIFFVLIYFFYNSSKLHISPNFKKIALFSLPFLTSILLIFRQVADRVFVINMDTINVYYRIMAWQDALIMFSKSPILGIGYNRFGDFNKSFYGIEGLFFFAREGLYDWTSHYNHPHNLYLFILSELGVVGLALFSCIFISLFRYFKSKELINFEYSFLGRLIIVYALANGLFGNGLEAPSVAAPFGLIIGYLIYYFENDIDLILKIKNFNK